jgi:hypothetical protein
LAAAGAPVLLGLGQARADTCVRYTFQPDCYQDGSGSGCVQTIDRLDLGPQIAVWIEDANGGYVGTAMVTAATSVRGIGNRPGIWNFLSGPKFPYGKRQMVLPVWAHARGVLYDTVMMQNDEEDWLGWHEPHSSEEDYYCRPLMPSEVMVDAITCPTKFNSAKGKYDPTTKSYYPPRKDLTMWINQDCDAVGGQLMASPSLDCTYSGQIYPVSSKHYATDNDLDGALDTVSAATPPYGNSYSGLWYAPVDFPAGDYAVMVEVNKEFDNNASHQHPSFEDPRLVGYGIKNNFGQPSVVYRVPLHIEDGVSSQAAVAQIVGYSDWTGQDGSIIPRDATISTTDPGSGEMRLLLIDGPTGPGRVHVNTEQCGACATPPPAPAPVAGLQIVDGSIEAMSVMITFQNAAAGNGMPVQSYNIRYRVGSETTMSDAEFASATPAPMVQPGAPGTPLTVTIADLKPATSYTLGVRAIDSCRQGSALATVTFDTTVAKFTQLSGCFVATAAYGSELEPGVTALRAARDRLRSQSGIFAAATDLYYRSGPAAADVLRRSDTARAAVRTLLGPITSLAEAAFPSPDHSPR